MLEEIVFATNNSHKLEEIKQIIGDKFKLLSLREINCNEEIPENAMTIAGNSLEKAMYVYKNYHKNCFADDTGLEITALDGRPGVYSARYAGADKNMNENIEKVLSELTDKNNRDAQFVTVITLIIDGVKHQFEGIVKGEIIDTKRGTSGFGYDPIFVPKGYKKTFAEMNQEEKNKISHRAIATSKFIEFLNKL